MKVCIDKEKCIGCGNCVAKTYSSVFDFSDEGLAETIVDVVPEDLEKDVKEAIEECPTSAISEVNEK